MKTKHVVRGLIAEHIVNVDAGTRLEAILELAQLATNSRHHQAVDRVADSLRVVARASDGTIEALEASSPRVFGLRFNGIRKRRLVTAAQAGAFTHDGGRRTAP